MNDNCMKTDEKISSLSDNYEQLKSLIESIKSDFEKFQNRKVKAAGHRVRCNLLNSKKLCDILRKQIMLEIKAIPTKHRIKDSVEPEEEPKINPVPLVRESTSLVEEAKNPE